MSRINFAIGALVLPLALLSTQAQPLPNEPGTAVVSGAVTLKGEPSCGVTVKLEQRPRARNIYIVTTDENGRFRMTNVAAGKYWITTYAPGYISPGNDGSGTSGQSLNVAEGAKIENIALEPEIKRGGVITGRITDSSGAPAPREKVYVHWFDENRNLIRFYASSAGASENLTDDRGVYRIYGLPEGSYLVGVVYEHGHSHSYYPSVTSETEAKVIEVTEGSETTDIDITKVKGGVINGRILNAKGEPVTGAEIWLVMARDAEGKSLPQGGLDRRSRSDDRGVYRFWGLMPGTYVVFTYNNIAGHFGCSVEKFPTYHPSSTRETAAEVTVRSGVETSGIDIRYRKDQGRIK
jgi:protocatechuate 3,4-dioxygenase beta subunit